MKKTVPGLFLSLSFVAVVLLALQPNAARAQDRLKQFAPPGFAIGGVLHGSEGGFDSAEYRNVARQEFNAITVTAYMPWGGWDSPESDPDTFGLERVVDWAVAEGKRVHGHVLVYPDGNKSLGWWQRLPDKTVARKMQQYIRTMAGKRAGKVWVWDVVNEVMAENDQPMDESGLRTNYKEYRAMGASYVDQAFRWAKEADPNALLILNDYGIENWNDKSTRLYNYAIKLRSRGVPIDGIGFQMHFVDTTSRRPDIDSMKRNFQRFADAGFRLFVTEMDVCAMQTDQPSAKIPGVTTPSNAQLQRQRLYYEQILQLTLQQPACKAFLMWDYADDFSWLHKSDRQIGTLPAGTYTYPAPFWCGKHCPIARKPAFDGMLNVLKSTSKIAR